MNNQEEERKKNMKLSIFLFGLVCLNLASGACNGECDDNCDKQCKDTLNLCINGCYHSSLEIICRYKCSADYNNNISICKEICGCDEYD